MDFGGKCITITFGDQAENHKGMQIIGELADSGFNYNDLQNIKANFEDKNYNCNLYDLKTGLVGLSDEEKNNIDNAYLLIIKNGSNYFLSNMDKDSDDLFTELTNLKYDDKAFMYGRVVNKHARHNLCFSDFKQKSKYSDGKGTVVDFKDVKLLNQIRKNLHKMCTDKAENLQGEANLYFDVNQCGISYHGDKERFLVVGVRLGETIPLAYQWYYKNDRIGDKMIFNNISHGDIYIMSEKATGNDWKKKNTYTLRHAAGSQKYIA